MKPKVGYWLVFGIVSLAAIILTLRLQTQSTNPDPMQLADQDASQVDSTVPEAESAVEEEGPPKNKRAGNPAFATEAATPSDGPQSLSAVAVDGNLTAATNRLERLIQTQAAFRLLAAGDRTDALLAAKQVTNQNERETALLTLVTEWTKGELSPPVQRARAIARYGLEAGLGIELAKDPDLAVLWASELTDGPGRVAILQQTAMSLVDSEPAAAFALSEQLPESDRRKFYDAVLGSWANKDTEAALQWAAQIPDLAEQDAAIQTIRTVAPVGIGAALSMQNGYPVISVLIPGTPAELSGQLSPGDRILSLAQGDGAFVNARDLPLADVVQQIRGAPGTLVQLQIMSADAPPDSAPRTVSITRDQIKYKR